MDDLQAVITFMYTGETKVKANDIKRFLTTAHELKVAGLIKNKEVPSTETLAEEMDPEDSKEVEVMIENMENEFEVESDAVLSDVETSEAQENDESFMTTVDETENVDNSKRMNRSSPKEEGKEKTVEKMKFKRKGPKRKEKIDPEVLKKEMDSRLNYVFDRALQKAVYLCTECNVSFTKKEGARYHVELHLSGAEEAMLKRKRT